MPEEFNCTPTPPSSLCADDLDRSTVRTEYSYYVIHQAGVFGAPEAGWDVPKEFRGTEFSIPANSSCLTVGQIGYEDVPVYASAVPLASCFALDWPQHFAHFQDTCAGLGLSCPELRALKWMLDTVVKKNNKYQPDTVRLDCGVVRFVIMGLGHNMLRAPQDAYGEYCVVASFTCMGAPFSAISDVQGVVVSRESTVMFPTCARDARGVSTAPLANYYRALNRRYHFGYFAALTANTHTLRVFFHTDPPTGQFISGSDAGIPVFAKVQFLDCTTGSTVEDPTILREFMNSYLGVQLIRFQELLDLQTEYNGPGALNGPIWGFRLASKSKPAGHDLFVYNIELVICDDNSPAFNPLLDALVDLCMKYFPHWIVVKRSLRISELEAVMDGAILDPVSGLLPIPAMHYFSYPTMYHTSSWDLSPGLILGALADMLIKGVNGELGASFVDSRKLYFECAPKLLPTYTTARSRRCHVFPAQTHYVRPQYTLPYGKSSRIQVTMSTLQTMLTYATYKYNGGYLPGSVPIKPTRSQLEALRASGAGAAQASAQKAGAQVATAPAAAQAAAPAAAQEAAPAATAEEEPYPDEEVPRKIKAPAYDPLRPTKPPYVNEMDVRLEPNPPKLAQVDNSSVLHMLPTQVLTPYTYNALYEIIMNKRRELGTDRTDLLK